MILSKPNCCLWSNGVLIESLEHTCVLRTSQESFLIRNMTRTNAGITLSFCEALTFLMENIYMQFEYRVYQRIVPIPIGTNCAPLITNSLLSCYVMFL